MKRKSIVWCISLLLLAVCIICGLIYAKRQGQAKNDIFTDAFFENMESISVFTVEETALKGEAAKDLVIYLKSLQLKLAEDVPITDAGSKPYYGGNQGYCVYYQNGEAIHFSATGALLTIGSRNYYVVDRNGELVPEFDKTIWGSFYPEA